jgi:hypothetical protein
MRVLVFIEPVIFWDRPEVLEAHLIWARQIETALEDGDELAVASSPRISRHWQEVRKDKSGRSFEIDPFMPLQPFDWTRTAYMAGLYATDGENPPLQSRLEAIRAEFRPDLVVATSQSSFFKAAFRGVPQYYVEQAPLPRFRQPFRTSFDPLGHQVDSLLSGSAEALSQRPVAREKLDQASDIVSRWGASLIFSDMGLEARAALRDIRSGHPDHKIAILATQPPDWASYEGAYRPVDLSGLLCQWAEQLPPGWIGIPTFHDRGGLSADMQQALAASNPRLAFLPDPLAVGVSEPLIASADAVVSISSTSSITAILLGKPAVTVGRCALDAWTGKTVADVAGPPVEPDVAIQLFMFLSHRFSITANQIASRPQALRRKLARHAEGAGSDGEIEIENWTAEVSGGHLVEIPAR